MWGLCTAVCYLHPIRPHIHFIKPGETLQYASFYCAELKYGRNYASSHITEIFHFIPFYLQKGHFEN